jgi:hypothetical protein
MGGAEAIANVHSIKIVGTRKVMTAHGDNALHFETLTEYPDKLVVTSILPTGNSILIYTSSGGFVTINGRSMKLTPAVVDTAMQKVRFDPIYIAQHADDPKYSFADGGKSEVNGTAAQVLSIQSADGQRIKWYIDAASGVILRAETPLSWGTVAKFDYAQWTNQGSVTLPLLTTMNSDMHAVDETESVSVNPAVDENMFNPPSDAAAASDLLPFLVRGAKSPAKK